MATDPFSEWIRTDEVLDRVAARLDELFARAPKPLLRLALLSGSVRFIARVLRVEVDDLEEINSELKQRAEFAAREFPEFGGAQRPPAQPIR